MLDRVGQQMGQYRLVRLLGRGGFAEVYLGQHVHLASRQAAVKILHMTNVDVEAFKKEAETTVQLEHPHIVRLLDFDIAQGTPFLVLDFAPGGSLRTRHPTGKIVPLASIVGYLKEIASALQYAHNNNIIHRDIKPENILIGRRNELLLSDFGISVLSKTGRTSLEHGNNSGGTAQYMAPEMFRGKPEKASDQYALGIVVYEWLSGTPPFTEGSAIQLGYQHTYVEIPPLREKNPAISPDVAAVVMTALSKDPEKRFGSVSAFANAFEQACSPSNQPLPRVESTPSQSSSPRIPANQGTPRTEAISQQFEQRAAPVQPVSQQNASPPPAQNPYTQPVHPYAQPTNPYTQPYTPPYSYPPQVNPYPYAQPMPPVAGPYIQSLADQTKQKRITRNKRTLLFAGIGGGVAGGAVATGIFAAQYTALGATVTERLIAGAIVGAGVGIIQGAIVGAISSAVIRKQAGNEALAFSGSIETGIITIAALVAGVAIALVIPITGQFALCEQFAVAAVVAVIVAVIAGALAAGIVRKKSSSKSS